MISTARRQELLRIDTQVRIVRWLVVPFAFAQFLLYRPESGVELPYNPWVMASLVAVAVSLTNFASIAAQRVQTDRALHVAGIVQLAADTALAVGIVWMFTFDQQSALWAILIIPVLEGAIRWRVRGAILTWAGAAVGYVAREIAAPHLVEGATFEIPSVTYRLGIVLVVALSTGYLAKNLEDRIRDHEVARMEADRRAELLHTVAQAAQTMHILEPIEVIKAVVDACVKAGFEGSGIALIDIESNTFSFAEFRGLSQDLGGLVRPADQGVVGEVTRKRTSVVRDQSVEWVGPALEAKALGFRAVIASPIWVREDLSAVLIAGTRERDTILAHEVEGLELLAAHAGAAFSAAQHFTERQQLKEQLEHEAHIDQLTGLPNRTLFSDRLAHCLERKQAFPSATAVLMIDLDRFGKVNESLGHPIGDEVLRLVSERLQHGRSTGDTVARYGADDFTVLIEEPESEREVLEYAERVVEDINRAFVVEGQEVYISASVGVAYGQDIESHPRDLLREADVAMYRAKERGGARVEIYRPVMTMRAKKRMELETGLRQAIDRREVEVFYQPAVAIQTGQVVGLEALARWRDAKRGVVPASDFIPIAEETGLIVPLGRHILESVMDQLANWKKTRAVPKLTVSVNVSAAEFGQPDFVDRLVRTIETRSVDPAQVILEVTEGVVMRDDRITNMQMRKLEDTGIRLAIDDFGLGYSALSYLKRFKFSVLKIDRSFITDVATRETDQAIVRYVLALAGDLGIPVVAEGVETQEQMDYLKSVDCQFVQGYLCCRPLNAADLERFVQEQHGNGNGSTSATPPRTPDATGQIAASEHEPA